MSNRLNEIEHIVILMMENRSFDHMLGYLSLEGEGGRTDVDGLTGGEFNVDSNNTEFKTGLSAGTSFLDDPSHDWNEVAEQLSDGNGGFVRNFEKHRKLEASRRIMDRHNADHVPFYDFLAKEYCISDRWFACVPGATQPNRMYALAGNCEGNKENLGPLKLASRGWKVEPIFNFLPDDVSWRCYSFDISTLRFVNKFRGNIPQIDKIYKFYDAAASGNLANVTWIDPHFDLFWGIYPGEPNDDHPDHDIVEGQKLAASVYNALVNGPKWDKTLFVVVYDEHGGFYDHVPPGSVDAPDDDHADFRQYGVRVPAMVVSPWAEKGKCYGRDTGHVFDHTSVLKTILQRFCANADGSLPDMGKRVNGATDLSEMLTRETARAGIAFDGLDDTDGLVSGQPTDLGFTEMAFAPGDEVAGAAPTVMDLYRMNMRVADSPIGKHNLDILESTETVSSESVLPPTDISGPAPVGASELQIALRELANSIIEKSAVTPHMNEKVSLKKL